jgi:two-component SAPR family response regulator
MNDVEVLWNGERIEGKWNQRGAKELLLYLILHHGAASRKELIETFLSDLPYNLAQNRLYVRIHHLNQIFRDFHDQEVNDILLTGEDTVALNAELESDFGDYIKQLSHFSIKSDLQLKEQAIQFIDLLKQYHNSNFSTFRGDWIFHLTNQIELNLSSKMQSLIQKMQTQKMFSLMCEVLQSGRSIEPYDGFCDERLAELYIKLEKLDVVNRLSNVSFAKK